MRFARLLALLLILSAGAIAQPTYYVAPIYGYGTLSVTNTSVLVSSMTPSANSIAWPGPVGTVSGVTVLLNDSASANNVYVCVLGENPCTAAIGLELIPGRAWQFYRPSPTMTVISSGTATLQVTY